MGNYIDCQLKVEGPKEVIEKFKNLTLEINSEHKHCYETFFERLMPGIEGVLTKEYAESLNLNDEEKNVFQILEDFTQNFDFEYCYSTTFYEWFGNASMTKVGTWNEPYYWGRLSITDTSIIVNFTTNNTPPIILIIGGSKIFPELSFRLSFYDTCNPDTFNCIEGCDGNFKETDLKIFLINFPGDRIIFKGETDDWYYSDTNELINEEVYPVKYTDILFDNSEPNCQRSIKGVS